MTTVRPPPHLYWLSFHYIKKTRIFKLIRSLTKNIHYDIIPNGLLDIELLKFE
jgi:hypothetical protein